MAVLNEAFRTVLKNGGLNGPNERKRWVEVGIFTQGMISDHMNLAGMFEIDHAGVVLLLNLVWPTLAEEFEQYRIECVRRIALYPVSRSFNQFKLVGAFYEMLCFTQRFIRDPGVTVRCNAQYRHAFAARYITFGERAHIGAIVIDPGG